MSTPSRLKVFYLLYLSKPTIDRQVYREIRRQGARKILELGMGTGRRALRMIQIARLLTPAREIRYIGIDPFEARAAADGPGMTLKQAHCLLKGSGAGFQLIPGDPFVALSEVANQLGQVDLMVLSSGADPQRLARTWYYVPRLLHERSQVFLAGDAPGGQAYVRWISRGEIHALAAAVLKRRAA